MGAPKPKIRLPPGSNISLRPFYTTVLFLSCFAAYSLVATRYNRRIGLRDSLTQGHDPSLLFARSPSATPECREVRNAVNQCAFVKANCEDDEAGLLSYLTLYYCDLHHNHGIAFMILVAWLGMLFTTIGIAASDFFSVNLSTISNILGLSQSLAGVTFLALGNGSPDVFSTFAAMGSNSASMAVGELIGAASFITAVVAGSMALVREFKVGRRTYVRDICFFIVAVIFTMCFLADGHLHLWECIVMIVYYIFYVFTVVTWHWYSNRRKRRLARDHAARTHVYGSLGHANDELADEPYRDDPDDHDAGGGGRPRRASHADISALEAGPRIQVEGEETDVDEVSNEEDDDGARGRQVAAEMASSMRVLRPRGRRSTTITPIRPSLVGALEFRSALAQLQKESNLRMGPIRSHGHTRAYSDSEHRIDGVQSDNISTAGLQPDSPRHSVALGQGEAVNRNRALSTGAVPPSFNLPPPLQELPQSTSGASTPAGQGRNRSPSPAYQIGGNLAPPPIDPGAPRTDATGEPSGTSLTPRLPQLVIPSPGPSLSERSSPTSPFPAFFTDSPMVLTPNPQNDRSEYFLPPPGIARLEAPIPPLPVIPNTRPVKWWPYAVLPPPEVVHATLFPTLQGWSEKSHWDKLVSMISVPSILLLVITLPVSETDGPVDLDDEPIGGPSRAASGHQTPPIIAENSIPIEQETEWQRYRRNSRSRSRSNTARSSPMMSPALIAVHSPGATRSMVDGHRPSEGLPFPPVVKHAPADPSPESDLGTTVDEELNVGWNRWLVALQLFTGPLFSVAILWANMYDELEQPGKVLVRMTLISLLGSTILLGILLLTTSPDRKPKYHFLLCFLGFIISIAWISTIAGEVVGVLKAVGVILGISEALLGLTVFAAGNSVGDLIADITVARLGYPVMALSACFGGPMLNILLGIGCGGAWMMTQAAKHRLKKHPDKPFRYKPYKIRIDGTLMISAITLLITLLLLLIVVPMNKWILSRKIGYGLIALWATGTAINLVVETTGVWTEVSLTGWS
ncbi:hypothetical protein VdG1_01559 [Verticillium dahliae VDG1]|nr:hypothetical protein VdG1_01559 [Verticillium dahliae VDG1]